MEKSIWKYCKSSVDLYIEKPPERSHTMNLPFPNLEHRTLSMREQVIERLLEIDPTNRRSYLETLKDFALLQSLQVLIELHTERITERIILDHGSYMFDAGIKYERERIINQLSEGK